MKKIIPCFWFDTEAEEAANFYVSVFSKRNERHKKIRHQKITHYTEAGQETHGKKPGSVMTVVFELDGQEFTD